ncbi:LytTR family transcriptional regulator [Enterococcus avium]|uniref:LytTR family DNA-binding domain-containing protein n=1 Tax=Enterococcus malodoratus TaxID=71451 RepID=UPI0008CA03DF|nr:LytTR family DNA-binding domain-containing protein [Enterococcus malodoratus]BBM16499.1 LytTR family transcriptional regulator [Enterococcus avium]SET30525.1 LytTr DNA-binding domain-containing protein [Enterococcus malodoratus]
MRIKLFQEDALEEDRTEIYYREMTEQIEIVRQLLEDSVPQLFGLEDGEQVLLSLEEIFYIDTVDKKTFAYLREQVYQIQGSLTFLESALSKHGFCRISKANIVNIQQIERVKSEANMRLKVVLNNQEELVISRYYRKIFQNYLKKVRGILHD